MKDLSIYIHIPFCKSRCHYCSFYSNVIDRDVKKQEETEKAYFARLFKEIESYEEILKTRNIKTIYIGGGTPSTVGANYITSIIYKIKKMSGKPAGDMEITVEVNPCSVCGEEGEKKLTEYKKAGVNRISIGMQTCDDGLLKTIGRSHTKTQFAKAMENIKKQFDNFSIDIMLGLPKQNLRQVKQAARFALGFKPTHISCYDLILEEGTEMHSKLFATYNERKNEDEVLKMRRSVDVMLQQKGIYKYEVSNYAKKGYKSIHNLNYWNMGDYLGLGAGAYSKLNDEEFENTEELNYKQSEKHKLTNKEVFENYVMLGLRTTAGIDFNQCKTAVIIISGQNEWKKKEIRLKELKKQDFIKVKNGKIFASKTGFNILNKIILELI